MKLDRNINPNGMGKYALLRIRNIEQFRQGETFGNIDPEIEKALALLEKLGIIDWGDEPQAEFFVIRLKDKYAYDALTAYWQTAQADDPEYAADIAEMAGRSGPLSKWCKRPD